MRVVEGILAFTAVSVRDVQLAVRPEEDAAAVMIPKRPLNGHQLALGGGIYLAVVAHLEFTDNTAQRFVRGIKDVQFAVGLELRMERHTEQAFLILHVRLAPGNIEEHLSLVALGVLGQLEDGAALFQHEHSAIGQLLQPQGPLELEVGIGIHQLQLRQLRGNRAHKRQRAQRRHQSGERNKGFHRADSRPMRPSCQPANNAPTNSPVPATSTGNPTGHGPANNNAIPTITKPAGTKGNINVLLMMQTAYRCL